MTNRSVANFWKRALWQGLLAAIFMLSLWSLMSGASWLLHRLHWLGGLPIGNLLAWLVLISGSLLVHALARGFRKLRGFCVALILFCVAWLPYSIYLAGNIVLDFQAQPKWRFDLWAGSSLLLAALLALCGVVLAALMLWRLLTDARRGRTR